ncbi:alpha/beta fold hydrolase [Natronospira bacteriovora]|uniref:Alpha/beta hydrolase n=1 Tax=Natronospira bacteriovora TaxID=3069753 RepID=A0ABU0W4F7_9GAMM|nr:alpha/beta hydrolase [Natronospira sp. AB-CW4]MDQ2068783.1 alpha/beta hydrolase [Natronospira sp. AB-CW4]
MHPDTSQGFLDRDGSRLRYCSEGKGRPLFVIGSSRYYPPTFSESLKRSCRMHFADMRHFAELNGPAAKQALHLNDYLDDIEAIRETLGLEDVVLLGHSHHGNLALEYARCFPDSIAGLVLVGTPPCNVAETLAASERYWREQADARRKSLLTIRRDCLEPDADFVSRYVADAPLYWYDPSYDATWLWEGVPINATALTQFKRFFVAQDFARAAAQVTVPVLAITGRHDYIVPPSLWDEHDAPFWSLTRHCLERSGHTPQLEQAQTFDECLLTWLNDHTEGPR